MSAGVRKTLAALLDAFVTISVNRVVRNACKVSPLAALPSATAWSIGGVKNDMISGMSRLINDLCGEFTSVVPVSVNFLFFLSLV